MKEKNCNKIQNSMAINMIRKKCVSIKFCIRRYNKEINRFCKLIVPFDMLIEFQ